MVDLHSQEFPDNVSDFRVINPSEFSVTFNAVYGSLWVSTELAQLYAIHRHAWDKTSASGPIGNYDLTTSGAEAVYNFLNKQSLSDLHLRDQSALAGRGRSLEAVCLHAAHYRFQRRAKPALLRARNGQRSSR